MKKSNEIGGLFTAVKALRDFRHGKRFWVGGALIVATSNGGWQAIPGAYLSDVSYTGSRMAVELATVRTAADAERAAAKAT